MRRVQLVPRETLAHKAILVLVQPGLPGHKGQLDLRETRALREIPEQA